MTDREHKAAIEKAADELHNAIHTARLAGLIVDLQLAQRDSDYSRPAFDRAKYLGPIRIVRVV